jgi:hypothetical protein
MNPTHIFFPVAAMMLLVGVVTCLMLHERMTEMKLRKIHPKKVASSTQMSRTLEQTQAADNYKNLFEMPVFFYVLCIALFATQKATHMWCMMAWIYVALRVVHSYIHISYNNVMHRFTAFAISTCLLVGLWIGFIWELVKS